MIEFKLHRFYEEILEWFAHNFVSVLYISMKSNTTDWIQSVFESKTFSLWNVIIRKNNLIKRFNFEFPFDMFFFS